jgi:hypothetical protein
MCLSRASPILVYACRSLCTGSWFHTSYRESMRVPMEEFSTPVSRSPVKTKLTPGPVRSAAISAFNSAMSSRSFFPAANPSAPLQADFGAVFCILAAEDQQEPRDDVHDPDLPVLHGFQQPLQLSDDWLQYHVWCDCNVTRNMELVVVFVFDNPREISLRTQSRKTGIV